MIFLRGPSGGPVNSSSTGFSTLPCAQDLLTVGGLLLHSTINDYLVQIN